MKRLVTLALVLAMASCASAGVAFLAYDSSGTYALPVVNGMAWATPGSVITVKLVVTGGTSVGFDIGAIVDTRRSGTASNMFTNAALTSMVSPGYLENSQPQDGVIGALISLWSYATTGTPLASGSTLASFEYQVGFEELTVISTAPAGPYWSALDNQAYVINESTAGFAPTGQLAGIVSIDSLTIGEPEPMTLGLLGLGSLFLRRRLA